VPCYKHEFTLTKKDSSFCYGHMEHDNVKR
jgi:hypothetical protein